MVGPRGGWAARFVRLLLAFPAERGVKDVSGASRGGTWQWGWGGGFFSSCCGFPERLGQATWEGGREGCGGGVGWKEPPLGQPQAHLQENSGWESTGNSSDPSSPRKTRPFPFETCGPGREPVENRCVGLGRRSGRARSCQVNAAGGNVREVSVCLRGAQRIKE